MTNLKTNKLLNLPENFLAIFLPLLIQQILQTILGSMDVLILSQRSDQLVAAAGLANQILITGSMFLGIVEIGMTVILTQLSATGEDDKVRSVIQNGVWLSFLLSLSLNLLIFLAGPQLLDLMQATEDIHEPALQYLKIVGISLLFQSFMGSLGAVYRSFAHLKAIMLVSLGVNLVNIVGNALVILTPFPYLGEGIVGVANATLLARIVGAMALIVLFPRLFPSLGLSGLLPQPKKTALTKILGLGFPAGLESVSYNLSQTILMGLLASLGSAVISSKIYTETVTSYVFSISASIAMASQIIVGKTIGQGDKNKAEHNGSRIFYVGTGFVLALMVILAFGSFIWAGWLTNGESVRITTIKLTFLSIALEPLRTMNCVLVSNLNAAGDVRYPVIVGIITSYIMLMPLSYLFAIVLEQGIIGVWIARIFDEGIRAYLFFRRWRTKDWMKIDILD